MIKDYSRGVLHGLLIFLLIFVPGFLIGQQSNTGRNYTTTWNVPTGMTFLITSSTCPAGTSEVTALDGAMPYGTLAAHGDIGGTGGANSVTPTIATLTAAAQTFTGSSATTSSNSAGTPAGTNGTVTGPAQVITWPAGVPTIAAGVFTQPTVSWPAGVPTHSGTAATFSGNALGTHTHTTTATGTISALTTGADSSTTGGVAKAIAQTPTFTGNSVTSSAVSAGTPAGTVTISNQGTIAWPAGVPTNASGAFAEGAISWPAGVPTNATSTIPAETFTGSALAGHTHTLTATGTNGTSAVTGTLSSVDNRSAFVKVIWCQKT